MVSSKILLSLSSLALCNAGVVSPRQTPTPKAPNAFGGLGDILKNLNGKTPLQALQANLPAARIATSTSKKTILRDGAKRIDVQYGPYTLVGKGQPKPKGLQGSLDPNGQAFVDLISNGLCTNCTILSGKTRVTFEDGSEAGPKQGVYIHHVINRDLTKPANLPVNKCGEGQTSTSSVLGGAEFLAQGDDSQTEGAGIYFTSKDGKFPSGYLVGPQIVLMNQIDLVNYNKDSKQVYVNFEIEYVEGHVGSDASSTLMSVTGCQNIDGGSAPKPKDGGHSHGAAPKNTINLDKNGVAVTESPKFRITKDSKIVSSFGHMHDGGSKMQMLVNGKIVCDSNAVYGKGGDNNAETILYMSECPEGIPLKKDDILELKSVYDLKTHPLREGGEHNSMGGADVMGMFYMTFAIDKTN